MKLKCIHSFSENDYRVASYLRPYASCAGMHVPDCSWSVEKRYSYGGAASVATGKKSSVKTVAETAPE